jgi:hypothetical protein
MHDYASPKQARQQLRDYVQFYNHQCLHQALDYQTPASIYFRRVDQAVAQHEWSVYNTRDKSELRQQASWTYIEGEA